MNALGPVRSLKYAFSRIYGSHLKDEYRASKINRIWTAIFAIISLGLGIAFTISCSSSMTSNTHLVSVNTQQFILEIANSTLANSTLPNNNTLVNTTSNSARGGLLNTFQRTQARLPEQYLFGFSGCCRIYTNNSKSCTKSFPQSPDILTTVVSDVNSIANNSINPVDLLNSNFTSMQKSYATTSTVYTALITTSVAWAFLSAIFILLVPQKSALHLIASIPGVLIAAGGTAYFTWCIAIQLTTYQLGSSYGTAISFGPGAYILWAWMICIMLLTPLTAMISTLVVLAIVLIVVWIAFIVVICFLGCLCGAGGAGGGNGQQDDYPQGFNNPPDLGFNDDGT